jgi:hypothetical protein
MQQQYRRARAKVSYTTDNYLMGFAKTGASEDPRAAMDGSSFVKRELGLPAANNTAVAIALSVLI